MRRIMSHGCATVISNVRDKWVNRRVNKDKEMSIEKDFEENIIGEAQVIHNLTIVPLISIKCRKPQYVLLEEALKLELVKITEVSEDGSVNEVCLDNMSEKRVLLVDGDEIIGAKQNRIINITILAPAKRKIRLPVTCVEEGRWDDESAGFSVSKNTMYASGRTRKMINVTESIRADGCRDADQGKVWDDNQAMFSLSGMQPETGAMSDLYNKYSGYLDDFTIPYKPLPDQTGAIYAINGQIMGMDLFDSPETFRKMADKLLRSFAIETIRFRSRRQIQKAPLHMEVDEFISDLISSDKEEFKSIGSGKDIRLKGRRITGGALIFYKRIIHLAGFRTNAF